MLIKAREAAQRTAKFLLDPEHTEYKITAARINDAETSAAEHAVLRHSRFLMNLITPMNERPIQIEFIDPNGEKDVFIIRESPDFNHRQFTIMTLANLRHSGADEKYIDNIVNVLDTLFALGESNSFKVFQALISGDRNPMIGLFQLSTSS